MKKTKTLMAQAKANDVYEVGCQLDPDQFTFVNLTRAELEQHVNNCTAALLEGS